MTEWVLEPLLKKTTYKSMMLDRDALIALDAHCMSVRRRATVEVHEAEGRIFEVDGTPDPIDWVMFAPAVGEKLVVPYVLVDGMVDEPVCFTIGVCDAMKTPAEVPPVVPSCHAFETDQEVVSCKESVVANVVSLSGLKAGDDSFHVVLEGLLVVRATVSNIMILFCVARRDAYTILNFGGVGVYHPFESGWVSSIREYGLILLLLLRGCVEPHPGPPKQYLHLDPPKRVIWPATQALSLSRYGSGLTDAAKRRLPIVREYVFNYGSGYWFCGSNCGYHLRVDTDLSGVVADKGPDIDCVIRDMSQFGCYRIRYVSYTGRMTSYGVCRPTFHHGFSKHEDFSDAIEDLNFVDCEDEQYCDGFDFNGSFDLGESVDFFTPRQADDFKLNLHVAVNPLRSHMYDFTYNMKVKFVVDYYDRLDEPKKFLTPAICWKMGSDSYCCGATLTPREDCEDLSDIEHGELISHFLWKNCFIHDEETFSSAFSPMVENYMSTLFPHKITKFKKRYGFIKDVFNCVIFTIEELFIHFNGRNREIKAGAIIQWGLDRGEIAVSLPFSYVFVNKDKKYYSYDPDKFKLAF